VHTLARVAVQRDVIVSKDIVYKLIHGGLNKRASSSIGIAAESSGPFDLLSKEVIDIYSANGKLAGAAHSTMKYTY
jgi:hypothetical protein